MQDSALKELSLSLYNHQTTQPETTYYSPSEFYTLTSLTPYKYIVLDNIYEQKRLNRLFTIMMKFRSEACASVIFSCLS